MNKRFLAFMTIALLSISSTVWAGPADDDLESTFADIKKNRPKTRAEAMKTYNEKISAFVAKWEPKAAESRVALANAYSILGQVNRSKMADYIGKAIAHLDEELKVNATNEKAKKMKSGFTRMLAQSKKREEAEKKRNSLIGKEAIELNVKKMLEGEKITLASLKGKVVVIDFWATWCGPCMKVIPHLIETKKKYDGKLEVLGLTKFYKSGVIPAHDGKAAERKKKLTEDEELEVNKQCAKIVGMNYPVIFVEDKTSQDYHVSGIPQVVVIDGKGVVRMIRVGAGDHTEFDEMVAKCIAELEAPAEATAEPKK